MTLRRANSASGPVRAYLRLLNYHAVILCICCRQRKRPCYSVDTHEPMSLGDNLVGSSVFNQRLHKGGGLTYLCAGVAGLLLDLPRAFA